jgi:hypothetical protein
MYLDNGHAWMPESQEKVQSGIAGFSLVYDTYSGIGIPASWSVRYR